MKYYLYICSDFTLRVIPTNKWYTEHIIYFDLFNDSLAASCIAHVVMPAIFLLNFSFMSHFPCWTGYPFLPDPALFLQQFRNGDQKILRMLFYHFFPALCFFARQLTKDDLAAEQIAEKSLEELWVKRSGMENLQAIKIFLYINTYQGCSQFIKTPQKNSNTVKRPENENLRWDNQVISAIIRAELFSTIEEMPDAASWLSNRLEDLPPFEQATPTGRSKRKAKNKPENGNRSNSPV